MGHLAYLDTVTPVKFGILQNDISTLIITDIYPGGRLELELKIGQNCYHFIWNPKESCIRAIGSPCYAALHVLLGYFQTRPTEVY